MVVLINYAHPTTYLAIPLFSIGYPISLQSSYTHTTALASSTSSEAKADGHFVKRITPRIKEKCKQVNSVIFSWKFATSPKLSITSASQTSLLERESVSELDPVEEEARFRACRSWVTHKTKRVESATLVEGVLAIMNGYYEQSRKALDYLARSSSIYTLSRNDFFEARTGRANKTVTIRKVKAVLYFFLTSGIAALFYQTSFPFSWSYRTSAFGHRRKRSTSCRYYTRKVQAYSSYQCPPSLFSFSQESG